MTLADDITEEIIPFTAGDGMPLSLIRVRRGEAPSKGPVLLVHGAGVRANIFRAPVETTVVDYLSAHGYDVWLENWRASTEVPANRWTLDQAALYDHPAAVKTVAERSGSDKVKALVHCQGSTSFTMSAVAGLLPEVTTIVSNAVSLHTVVPTLSEIKGIVAVPLVSLLTPYLNPQWGLYAPDPVAKLIVGWVRLTHHECDNDVCKMASFTYGSGFPTLWSHQNLNPQTHEWLKGEFGPVPLSFFEQMKRCINRGHLVAVEGDKRLPDDFTREPPQTDARFAFFAGAQNVCFLPESQRQSFQYFDAQRPRYHSLHVIEGYGHLDMFMGQHAARDVFPLMLEELEKPV
jgi:pimeloyl-ACP methyl ester carboxylesterase